jgi:hypothetical protein
MGSENRNGLSGAGGGGGGSGKGKSSSDSPTQKKARSKYDRAFKLEAIRLVEEMGMKGAQVARDLGIGQNALYRWLKAFREDREHSFCKFLLKRDHFFRRIPAEKCPGYTCLPPGIYLWVKEGLARLNPQARRPLTPSLAQAAPKVAQLSPRTKHPSLLH